MQVGPFRNIQLVRDEKRRLVAVTAVCDGCGQERSLSFGDVIGGIALRCPICGA
jgi:hypothetical protein